MMIYHEIPRILTFPGSKQNPLGMERALNQIKQLLEDYPTVDESQESRIQASLDDVILMIGALSDHD